MKQQEELLQEQNNMKSSKTLNALIIGVLIGISVYSAVNNGISFATLFPLFLAFLALNSGRKSKA